MRTRTGGVRVRERQSIGGVRVRKEWQYRPSHSPDRQAFTATILAPMGNKTNSETIREKLFQSSRKLRRDLTPKSVTQLDNKDIDHRIVYRIAKQFRETIFVNTVGQVAPARINDEQVRQRCNLPAIAKLHR